MKTILTSLFVLLLVPLAGAQLKYDYFVKTTAIVGTPSDSNDGKDPLGIALTGAAYDHTDNPGGERSLYEPGAFSSYTWSSGDTIYVFGTGGILTGLYEIAEKVDNNRILLSEDPGLTYDSTGADVTSSDGPWLTLQHMFDTAAAGSWCVICDDGGGTGDAWPMSATLDVDTQDGGTTGIVYQGANSRGVVDGTRATIINDGGTGHLVDINTVDNLAFVDLIFSSGAQNNMHTTNSPLYHSFFRCRFTGAGTSGAMSGGYTRFVDCELDACGVYGLYLGSFTTAIRCRLHDNGTYGVYASGSKGDIIDCLVYDNGASGIKSVARGLLIQGSVLFGNGGSGLHIPSDAAAQSTRGFIHNCVFRSNSGYGINHESTNQYIEIDYCCFSNNTSGATSGCDDFLGDNNIYTDPLFTSEVDGSEDFTPKIDSPLIGAGIQVPIR